MVSETDEAATIACQSSCRSRLYHSYDSDAEDEKHLICTVTVDKLMTFNQQSKSFSCISNSLDYIQLLSAQEQEWITKCRSSCCGPKDHWIIQVMMGSEITATKFPQPNIKLWNTEINIKYGANNFQPSKKILQL